MLTLLLSTKSLLKNWMHGKEMLLPLVVGWFLLIPAYLA
jgi:hypothetical protein